VTGPGDGFVLGVDLGTSNTVAMLRHPDGRTRPLLFDGQPLLPSATYLDTTGRLHVGADALRLGQAEPARIEPHPKRHVDDDSVLLGEASVPVADLLAALLGAVAREATATAGHLPPAVLTYPAAWGAARREVLTAALGKAGWPVDTRLIPEPVAAARYFADVLRRPVPAGAALAVFDFGGGTLDVAVVRNEGPGPDGRPRFAVAASGGADDLGGLDVDAALVDHLGKSLAGAEPAAWHALTEPVTLAQWRARQQFWSDVRGAKEMLSRSSFAPVPVPGVEHAVHLTRDELEAAADPLIRRGVEEAAAVIAAAGLAPAELAGLFLVGGSSRVPLVARLLHGELGIAPTVLEQPELPVAEGAILAESQAESRYAQGLAAAATPTPTPATAPDSPPPLTDTRAEGAAASPADSRPATDDTDDRQYAEPVDPWAAAEERALAAGGPMPYPVSAVPGSAAPVSGHGAPASGHGAPPWQAPAAAPGRPAGGPGRRKRTYLMAGAAAVTLVLAAGAVLAWAFWPGYRALDYHPLGDPQHIQPLIPVTYDWSDAAISGDRAYFASADTKTGRVGVVAVDIDTGKQIWPSDRAGTASDWESMRPLPDGLALFTKRETKTGTDTPMDKRRMAVLDASDGDLRWQRTLDPDDEVFFAGDTAVVNDRAGHRLVGVRLNDGTERWSLPDPASPAGLPPTVFAVTTPKDLDGPAGVFGRPFDPDLGDDPRIVQIGGDKSARVLDADSGKILTSRQSVAEPDDEVVAHNGRLIVHQPDGQRIVSYQLDRLGEPDVLYTAQAPNAQIKNLTPCGDDRVCFDQTIGYNTATAAVVALDVARGDEIWRYPLANAERLVPVGEAVLTTTTSTTDVTLIDADGKKVWTLAGEAVRLNGGNLMHFSKALSRSPSDPALAGQHLGDPAEPLGSFRDIRSDTCSWNTAQLACVADKDFVLIKYAG